MSAPLATLTPRRSPHYPPAVSRDLREPGAPQGIGADGADDWDEPTIANAAAAPPAPVPAATAGPAAPAAARAAPPAPDAAPPSGAADDEAAAENTEDEDGEPVGGRPSLFRQEAVAHHVSYRAEGELLRLSPGWTGAAYWLLCFVFASALLYAVLGRFREWATGPALVRVEGRSDVTARVSGTVAAVEVRPGQRVSAGQLLGRFYVEQEAAALSRIESEFELLLLRTLRDPNDQAARQQLSSLRAERDLARARLEERAIRSPVAGVVSDVRIRPGKHLQAGESVLSILSDNARFYVEVMLPGHHRPLLRSGQPLRLELKGYRYQYQVLSIDSIGDEVVGPGEVKRYLPAELQDAVTLDGPVVLVQARLPSPSFQIDGQSVRYYEGMQATAEVALRSERIVLLLLPALRAIRGR